MSKVHWSRVVSISYSEVHNGAILLNIKRRFNNDLIYVSVGMNSGKTLCFTECCITDQCYASLCSPSYSFSLLFPTFYKTYIGNLLVAVNPFETFDTYGMKVAEKYQGQPVGKLPP